nr:hypothetical protein [Angustibacter aerolatus]
MGDHAAVTAAAWGVDRTAQDEPTVASHHRLAAAWDAGFFDDLVTPYLGLQRDQNLRPDTSVERLGRLRPVFGEGDDATMTAGNSTPLTDGASAVLLASDEWAAERGQPVLAHVVDAETAAVDFVQGDEGLLMAPTYAVARLLARQGMTLRDLEPGRGARGVRLDRAGDARGVGEPRVLPRPAGPRGAARCRRPRPAQRDRVLARHGPPLRGHRWAYRRHPRQVAARPGWGPWAHLDLRRRRSGRRGHPGGVVTDRYTALVQGGAGRRVASTLGLPRPAVLRRHEAGSPCCPARPGWWATVPSVRCSPRSPARRSRLDGDAPAGDRAGADDRLGAVVVDATGHRTPRDLVGVRAALATDLRRLGRSGRLVVVGRPPEDASDVTQAATRQALEGLTRSLAKEPARGRHGQPGAGGGRRRRRGAVDPRLPAERALGLRRRAGGAGAGTGRCRPRGRRPRPAAAGGRRRGHRRRSGHRCRDRPRPRASGRPGARRGRARGRTGARRHRQRGRRHRAPGRRDRSRRRTTHRRPRPVPLRLARRRRAQRGHHPRQAAGQQRPGRLGLRARRQPRGAGCASTTRCSGSGCSPTAAAW